LKKILCAVLLLFTGASWANSDDLETSGDVVHLLLPATALGATLFYEEGNEGSWQLLKAAVSSRLIVEGLKLGVNKDRPDSSGACRKLSERLKETPTDILWFIV